MESIKATSFTTKRHISCNGCHFNIDNHKSYSCILSENAELLISLINLFGSCVDIDIIYVLKHEKKS